MLDRKKQALENHKKGYNCAQSVVCAYCDLFGIDEKTAFIMSEAYGLGMGSMGTCGTVTAMAMVTSMKLSDGNLEGPATKKVCYQTMKELNAAFIEKNHSLECREIKGTTGGPVLRSCDGCIEDAASLIEELLLTK